jgi:polysaccharide biosynthesis protein PslH
MHPVDKGGKIRTYEMLRQIAKSHHVSYLALNDDPTNRDAIAKASEYCARLEVIPFAPPRRGTLGYLVDVLRSLFSPLPYAISRYRSVLYRDAIRELVHADAFDLIISDFLVPMANLPPALGAPVVLFQHNVEAEIWRRHAEVASTLPSRLFYARQFSRMQAFEQQQCQRAARVIAVSEHDAAIFRDRYGVADVQSVDTGVDVDFFWPQPLAKGDRPTLVFTGSMDWMPNDDGVLWFLEEVFPQIRRVIPDVQCAIVGRSPSDRVKALATRFGVEVSGRVPDVRPYLARAHVAIVPLRVGGGTRLKIFEAMAMNLPVVSTTIGAEGLPVQDGVHLCVADTAADFARACAELLGDPETAGAMGETAGALVRQEFSWEKIAAQFIEKCSDPLPAQRLL